MRVQRSGEPMLFFSPREKRRIVQAIQTAETKTTGEIRVHLEGMLHGDALAHAAQLMTRLGMRRTEARTGVLILLAVATHQVVVFGDDAINAAIPTGFWDDIVARMADAFREDRFADGLVTAIERIGNALATFFPCTQRNRNELPDEISYSR